MPRRTPRRPSIGFSSCSRCTASSSSESVSCSLPMASATATFTDSSVKSGRNSCSGGSSRRTVTGSPSIASKISMKSARCSGSSSSKTTCRSSSPSARISRSTSSRRVAEEHVLGAAQADALGPEPAGAGGIRRVVGVGPHLHPAVLVGDGHQPVDGGDHGAALVDGHGALEVADDGGGRARRPRRGRPRRSSRRSTGCRPRARRCRRGWRTAWPWCRPRGSRRRTRRCGPCRGPRRPRARSCRHGW